MKKSLETTPKVAASEFLQTQLARIDLDLINDLTEYPRVRVLIKFHTETYIKRFEKILSKAPENKLIKKAQ